MPPPSPPLPPRAMPGIQVSRWKSTTRRDQAFAVAIGAVLLGCSALMLSLLNSNRATLVREDPESEKTLSSLAVTFPRLTLGGTRGIASTYLWIQAEEDKNDRKWMDLESKYTMIGAMQPYFASVYIFHSWNQAYNISAQWQEQEIKYKWVLDGIAYLYKGEEFNPGNPDILEEEAKLYSMKLGGAFERIYYREHWRDDIARMHDLNSKTKAQNDDTVALQHVRDFVTRRDPRTPPPPTADQLKAKSDEDLAALCTKWGIDLPIGSKPRDMIPTLIERIGPDSYFLTQELRDPAGRIGGTGWGLRVYPYLAKDLNFNLFKDRIDGKAATDPIDFPHGISPFYFAFIEYRRLLDLKLSPTYTSLQVDDAWPAMSLRLWCRDDLYYTYDTMRKMFGNDASPALLSAPEFNTKVEEVHECYRNVQMIAPRAVDLFIHHLDPTRTPNYAFNKYVHTKHMAESTAYREISKAEARLFDALVQWHINGRKFDAQGKIKAAFLEADKLYLDAVPVTEAWVETVYPAAQGNPDRRDFEHYVTSLQSRSRGIRALIQAVDAGQKPVMDFLDNEVVEK